MLLGVKSRDLTDLFLLISSLNKEKMIICVFSFQKSELDVGFPSFDVVFEAKMNLE